MIQEFKNFFDAQREAVITVDTTRMFQDAIAQMTDAERGEALFYVLGGWIDDIDGMDTREKQASIECVRLLMHEGVNPNIINNADATPLHDAVRLGYEECVRLLVGNGAYAAEIDTSDESLVQIAAFVGNVNILGILLANIGDENFEEVINNVDKWSQATALDTARAFGNDDCARLLEEHGARSCEDLSDDEIDYIHPTGDVIDADGGNM